MDNNNYMDDIYNMPMPTDAELLEEVESFSHIDLIYFIHETGQLSNLRRWKENQKKMIEAFTFNKNKEG